MFAWTIHDCIVQIRSQNNFHFRLGLLHFGCAIFVIYTMNKQYLINDRGQLILLVSSTDNQFFGQYTVDGVFLLMSIRSPFTFAARLKKTLARSLLLHYFYARNYRSKYNVNIQSVVINIINCNITSSMYYHHRHM